MRKLFHADNGSLSPSDGGNVLVLISPTAEERKTISDLQCIDDHFINSSLDPEELSRLELEPDYIRIIFKVPKPCTGENKFLFTVTSVGAIVCKDRLILISDKDFIDLEAMSRITSLKDVVLKLITKTIIHFREHLKGINMLSDELQKEINDSFENRHLICMFGLQKSLLYYVDALDHNKNLLDRMKTNITKIGLSTDEEEELEYLIIENNQCYKQAEMHSNILASLMDARASIVSNNLNVLMKTLNVITICIMVPTLVVSAFSMNVKLPMALSTHPLGFFIIIILAIFSAIGFLFWWKRKHQ